MILLHGPCHSGYEVPAREEALQEAAGLLNQRRPGGLENSASLVTRSDWFDTTVSSAVEKKK